MKTILLISSFLISSFYLFAQAEFEPAYFIDSKGKQQCFIKNEDWKNSPTKFVYKLTEESNEAIKSTLEVSEFGNENFKFVVVEALIDKSSDNIDRLTSNSEPVFVKEKLVLRQLFKSSKNLYTYENDLITRFFVSAENNKYKQLIYKKFLKYVSVNGEAVNTGKILINDAYRNQLKTYLNNDAISKQEFDNLTYTKNSLTKFFVKNAEMNSEKFLSFLQTKPLKEMLNIYAKIGISQNKLSTNFSLNETLDTDYDSKISLRYSIEVEYVLPYQNESWSIYLNPTYQSYNVTQVLDIGVTSEVSFKSIELPFGFRYYLRLNENTKFFVSPIFCSELDFDSKSFVTFTNISGPLDITPNFSIGGSAGVFVANRIQLSYQYSKKKIITNANWQSRYSSNSINLALKLF